MKTTSLPVLIAIATLLGGCASTTRVSEGARAEVGRLCDGIHPSETDNELRALYGDGQILAVSTMERVSHKRGYEEQVPFGARVIVRGGGATPSGLERALRCHAARTALGQLDRATRSNDPMLAAKLGPEGLDLEVSPAGENLAVAMTSRNVRVARLIVSRSEALAAQSRGSTAVARPEADVGRAR